MSKYAVTTGIQNSPVKTVLYGPEGIVGPPVGHGLLQQHHAAVTGQHPQEFHHVVVIVQRFAAAFKAFRKP